MLRRLSADESRAIKRVMRAAPGISQRIDESYVDDEGRFIIRSGGPVSGMILEAVKTEGGEWELQDLDR